LIDWHPVVIAGGRSFFAIFVLIALRYKHGKPKNIPVLFAAGFWYAATMILFVIANKLTFSANVIVLQYTAPIWACLLGWFFLKEKPYIENWFSLAFVCFGMLLIFGNSIEGGSFLGNLLALFSGITFAANSVVLRKFKDNNPLDVMLCAFILCTLFSIPFLFIYPPELNKGNILSILFMASNVFVQFKPCCYHLLSLF
jgi:drug/metabolite transporter (DMT)-like permease